MKQTHKQLGIISVKMYVLIVYLIALLYWTNICYNSIWTTRPNICRL